MYSFVFLFVYVNIYSQDIVIVRAKYKLYTTNHVKHHHSSAIFLDIYDVLSDLFSVLHLTKTKTDTCITCITAEHCIFCIAASVLSAYQQELNCHDLIPLCIYAYQDGSCCVKSITVLHLTVDACIVFFTCCRMFFCTFATTIIGSRCPEVM